MNSDALKKRYSTLSSFERILNTFYAISNFKLTQLKKNDNKILEESILQLAPYIKDYQKNNTNERNLVVVFFSNKGLCGGYNNNTNKQLIELEKTVSNIDYIIIGTRGKRYSTNRNVIKHITCKDTDINLYIEEILQISYEYNLKNIYFIYTKYINILKQQTISYKIINTNENQEEKNLLLSMQNINSKILYNCYITNIMYIIYNNTRKSEESNRIQTTFNAKKNTQDNIDSLRLLINKTRKIKTTTEILETSSASEALKNISI